MVRKKMARRWSEINQDILSEFFKKIKNPSDHIRCSSLNSSWRSAALRHRCNLPHSTPGLALAPRGNSLKRKFITITPSINRSDNDLLLEVSHNDTCCGSYRGWLVVAAEERSSIKMYLHNPFSKRRRLLPELEKKVYKAVLSSSPSFDPKCVVLILFQSHGAACCILGDDSWKIFKCRNPCVGFSDALLFEGRFYVVDDYGKIYACNVDNLMLIEIESQPSIVSNLARIKCYLVEIQGQLCVVLRKFFCNEELYYEYEHCSNDYYDDDDVKVSSRVSTREFRVWKMDPGTKEWVFVSNLGRYALFLGGGNSVCLSEIEVGGKNKIRGNLVYFTDDRHKIKHFGLDNPGKDMGIYDMSDMSIRPLYSDPWYEFRDDPPAIWVTPLPW